MSEDDGLILASPSIYMALALKCAVIVSVLEAPLLFLVARGAPVILPAAWMIIVVYTCYRVWNLRGQLVIGNDLSLSRSLGGIFVFALSVGVLFATWMATFSSMANDSLWLVKAAFISNPFAGAAAAALIIFMGYLAEKIAR